MIATYPNEDGAFAAVSCTSLKGAKDQTVILRAGEHPFLVWDTSIGYALAEIVTVAQLEERIIKGEARMHYPALSSVTNRLGTRL